MNEVIIVAACLLSCLVTNSFCYNNATPNIQSRAPFRLFMGVRSSIASLFTSKRQRTDEELKTGIAKFYDESSSIWLDVWGEDMHHGYYPNPDFRDHKAAQIGMIDRSLSWAYGGEDEAVQQLGQAQTMVDVGCGVGGSSRHIVRKYGVKQGYGLSLSPYQISRAQQFTKAANLTESLEYQVADAMNMPFNNDKFDLTWSMESGEHMPDKQKFMDELFRVTAPGGRILIVTWCHRELLEEEQSLTAKELKLLDKINRAYYLPDWVPVSHYVDIANDLGLEDVRCADWSEFVAPFWPAVIRSALRPRNFVRMVASGVTTIKGAIASAYMLRGFKKGLVKFVLITGKKKCGDAESLSSD